MLGVNLEKLSGFGVERVLMIGDSRKCDEHGPRESGVLGYHLDRGGRGRFRSLLEFSKAVVAVCNKLQS